MTDLAALSAELRDTINSNSADDAAKDQEHRWHLGISEIGKECQRAIWYGFRWYSPRKVDGRLARLYARGHAEELKIALLLERAGWHVTRLDPATGKQFLYSAVHGHYGGSCDGIGLAVTLDAHFILECKTHHTKSFSDVAHKGLIGAKPQHYAQMCGYGYAFKVEYGLYFPVNKNDDDIRPEFVRLSHDHGKLLEQRAEFIIVARTPPLRVSNKPTDFRCKSCDHFDVCHSGTKPLVHCRSCTHAYPTDNGEWWCNHHSAVIPRNIVRTGCASYMELNE